MKNVLQVYVSGEREDESEQPTLDVVRIDILVSLWSIKRSSQALTRMSLT